MSWLRLTLCDDTTHQCEEAGIAGMGDIDMVGNALHRAKFRSCVDPLLTSDRADRLWDALAQLDTLERLAPLLELASI